MFAAPPSSPALSADRALRRARRTRCAWSIAFVVLAAMPNAARADRPFPAATLHDSDDSSLAPLLPVSAEFTANDTIAPTLAADATHDAGAEAADHGDPLSRLRLPTSASQFDPAQTLKDWAEGAGLLIAIGIVGLWLVRQWVSRQDGVVGPAAHLRTIESLSLPHRCRLHLIDVDGRQVLVAVDATGIKSVTPLPDRFASLLEGADAVATPMGVRAPDQDTARHDSWDGRQATRLT